MTNPSKLPSELKALASGLGGQPENVRELFHYALVMLMVEDGKAEIIGTQHIDDLEYLTFKAIAGV